MTVLRAIEEVAEVANLARAAGELHTVEKVADGAASTRSILSDHALDLMGHGNVEQKITAGSAIADLRDASQEPNFRVGLTDTSSVEMAMIRRQPISLGTIQDMRELHHLDVFPLLDPLHQEGLERMARNKDFWNFMRDDNRLNEPVPHFRSEEAWIDIQFGDGASVRTYTRADHFNVRRPDGSSEIHLPTTGNRWRNVTKMFPDGRVELHEEDRVSVLKEAATHDFDVPWHKWPAELPGRPLGQLGLNTKHAVVLPPGGREYSDLRLRDILTPDDLPPLRDGYIRMVHHTNSGNATSIAQHGLHYDSYQTISSTMRLLEPAEATDWRSFASQDRRYNGQVAVVMDVPEDVVDLHNRGASTVQPSHKVMPPGYTVGIVGMPKDAQPIINHSDSWSPRRAFTYGGAMSIEDVIADNAVEHSMLQSDEGIPDFLPRVQIREVRNPPYVANVTAKPPSAADPW